MRTKRLLRRSRKIVTDYKKALFNNDEQARFRVIEHFGGLVYPKYKFSEFGRIFLEDVDFLNMYERFALKNYHSLDRKYTLYNLVTPAMQVPGDTAECGVYTGASSYLICRRIYDTGKKHCVFDSFEGLSEPGKFDGNHWLKGKLAAAEEEVRQNLDEFEFVEYYRGWIPKRFDEVSERSFCFVHIDVDLYEPTRDSIAFFYPRMKPGGILLLDDYGFKTCPGARRAADEYFDDKLEPIIKLPTGQAFVIIAGKS